MKESIKNLRIQIDGLAQLTKELKPLRLTPKELEAMGKPEGWAASNTKEINKAYDSLILAKAWLGKVLGELGTENPYGSGYKTVEDIVPTQDVAREEDLHGGGYEWGLYQDMNHIEKVDWLRCSIEDIIQEIIKLDLKGSRELAIARSNSYTHLCESKIYLGLELGRIRDIEQIDNIG